MAGGGRARVEWGVTTWSGVVGVHAACCLCDELGVISGLLVTTGNGRRAVAGHRPPPPPPLQPPEVRHRLPPQLLPAALLTPSTGSLSPLPPPQHYLDYGALKKAIKACREATAGAGERPAIARLLDARKAIFQGQLDTQVGGGKAGFSVMRLFAA